MNIQSPINIPHPTPPTIFGTNALNLTYPRPNSHYQNQPRNASNFIHAGIHLLNKLSTIELGIPYSSIVHDTSSN